MKNRSSPKRPRAGSAYAKAIEDDWLAQEALGYAQKRLKAVGAALTHIGKAAKTSDILLANLTKVTTAIRKKPSATLAKTMEAQQVVITDFAEMLAKRLTEARKKTQADWQKVCKQALAELDQTEQEYECEWQAQTGLTPPRHSTVEKLEQAIDWWKEQAAFVGISPDRILDVGERVQCQFEPIIRGKLRLLRLQAATVSANESKKHRSPTHDIPKEQPWSDEAAEYLHLTEAIRLTDERLSLSMLSKLLRPGGEMRYMRKAGIGCKVHVTDFRRFLQGRQSNPRWAKAFLAFQASAGKGDIRFFWRCSQCGREQPENPTATGCCPKCGGDCELIRKAPPEPH